MAKNNLFISDFYCVFCGKQGIPIPRKASKTHEAGHLKRLFCVHCGKETNHVEIRPFGRYTHEDFEVEYTNGNFDKEGNRKMTYGELRAAIHDGKI